MTRDDTAVRILLNQQPLLLLLLLRMNQGPQRLLKTAGLSCPPPPPLRRALDHQSNLLHECTQSATHQRATADLGQTAGIRWDYRPRCPLLFGCPPLPSSPSPPQKSPPPTPPIPILLWHCYREFNGKQKAGKNLLLVALFLCNTQTRSQTNETKHKHTLWMYKLLWELSLFNEGHNGVSPG